MTTADRLIERAAGRVLCVDPTGALLLQSVVDPAVPDVLRWVSPGGGVEPGESAHDAARRELWEEVGLIVDDLGDPVEVMSNEFGFAGRRYLGHNTFYAIRTPRFEPAPRAMTDLEQEFTRGSHWLDADALDTLLSQGAAVSPPQLAHWARRLHGALPPETVRPTVRVLVVDARDRVVLMRSRNGFWFPPGGGIEPGESVLEAGRRELREELGLDVGADGDIGPCVWLRRHVLPGRQGPDGPLPGLDLRERWHLLRVGDLELDHSGWTPLEVDTIDDVRWWTAEQIAAEPPGWFTPRALGTMLPRLLAEERAGLLAGRDPVEVTV